MAIIKPRRGYTNPSGLTQYELAVDLANKRIFIGNTGGTGDIVAQYIQNYVISFNGLTGAVTGVTTGTTNTFGPLQTFTNGISCAGATFNRLIISTAGFSGTGITLSGNLSAATKSFLIPHPIQPNKKLQYACLEGPENGVYVRGRLTDSNIIDLPDYWSALVHSDSITVQLTANNSQKNYFVKSIEENRIIVGSKSKDIDCFYLVQGERKDVPKLTVEY